MRTPVGLVPAAGQAARLGRLPCSKEIYPVAITEPTEAAAGALAVRPACQSLLEQMRIAGVRTAFVVVGQGKWDIPAYLDDGSALGLDLAYLTIRGSRGTPWTVDRAFAHVAEDVVAFGFPDIVLEETEVFARLLARRDEADADVVLGLFPAPEPEKVDMVDVDPNGRVRAIVVKPRETSLEDAWIVAVWTPRFTRFLHEYVAELEGAGATDAPERYVGDVVAAAIDAGLHVEGLRFPNGRFFDIGTSGDLARAAREGYARATSGPRPTAR